MNNKISVTIQSPFAKSCFQHFPFAHVATSPYKSVNTLLPMQALSRMFTDLHGSE